MLPAPSVVWRSWSVCTKKQRPLDLAADYHDDASYMDWWDVQIESDIALFEEDQEHKPKKQKTENDTDSTCAKLSTYFYLRPLQQNLVDDVIMLIQSYESNAGQMIDKHFDSTIENVIFDNTNAQWVFGDLTSKDPIWPSIRTVEIFKSRNVQMWHLRYEKDYGSLTRDEFKLDSFPDPHDKFKQESFPDVMNRSVMRYNYSHYNSPSTILFLPYPQILKSWLCLESQSHNHSVLYLANFRKLSYRPAKIPHDHFQVRFALNGGIVDNRVIGKFVKHVSLEQFRQNLAILKWS